MADPNPNPNPNPNANPNPNPNPNSNPHPNPSSYLLQKHQALEEAHQAEMAALQGELGRLRTQLAEGRQVCSTCCMHVHTRACVYIHVAYACTYTWRVHAGVLELRQRNKERMPNYMSHACAYVCMHMHVHACAYVCIRMHAGGEAREAGGGGGDCGDRAAA